MEISSLESELQSLYKQRDQVEYRLRGLESKERNLTKKRGLSSSSSFNSDNRDIGSKRPRDERSLKNDIDTNKKPRLSSVVATDREEKDKEREKDRHPKVTSHIVTSNPVAVAGEKPRASLKSGPEKLRNKKLFGTLLMGTLQSFKNDVSKKTQAALRRQELEQKVENKVMQEQEQEAETQKRQLEEEKAKETALREEIRKNQLEKEKELLRVKWESHKTQLSKFIKTEAKPHLYYKEVVPTNNDNIKETGEANKDEKETKEVEMKEDSKEKQDSKDENAPYSPSAESKEI